MRNTSSKFAGRFLPFALAALASVALLFPPSDAVARFDAPLGPCQVRGCDGQPTYCTSYTVMEIGNISITRSCKGTPLVQSTDPGEDTVAE